MGFYHEILLIRCVENEVSNRSIFLIQDDDDYVYVILFHWIQLVTLFYHGSTTTRQQGYFGLLLIGSQDRKDDQPIFFFLKKAPNFPWFSDQRPINISIWYMSLAWWSIPWHIPSQPGWYLRKFIIILKQRSPRSKQIFIPSAYIIPIVPSGFSGVRLVVSSPQSTGFFSIHWIHWPLRASHPMGTTVTLWLFVT